MEVRNLSKIRRLAVVAVAINLAALIAAAVALPKELHVMLPILALTLPLLSTGVLEALAERRSQSGTPRDRPASFGSLRHVAANGGA